MNKRKSLEIRILLVCAGLVAGSHREAVGRDLTLNEAVDIVVNHTSRGATIRGDVDVAERQYYARRINFYVPEVSLNAAAPSYSSDQSFRFFGGFDEKSLVKTTDLDITSNIQLKQSLITGGNLTARANLLRNDQRYPVVRQGDRITIDELTQQGFFDVSYEQPLLKPSDAKHELGNRRDDFHIAELSSREETGSLKKEVIESYFAVLIAAVTQESSSDKSIAAEQQANVDSLKMLDGVVPQETYLESSAARLDAELELTDANNTKTQSRRDLGALLELDNTDDLSLQIPVVADPLTPGDRSAIQANWEQAVPVRKAELQYEKSRRAAKYASAGHGISGNLTTSYSFGRGTVEADGEDDDQIKTNSWQIALNLSVPIWDGGSSGAEVKAAELGAEKSRIELDRSRKTAQTELANLLNRLDVSYQKLDVLKKKIEITKAKLDIAEFRFGDGQISEIEYRQSRVDHHAARTAYLEELKNYLLDRVELESKYMN